MFPYYSPAQQNYVSPYCGNAVVGRSLSNMIKIKPVEFEKIIEATCDCCNKPIKVDLVGRLEDHLIIGGHYRGKLLDAIVCIPCMEEKLSFINIQKKDSTVGYC